MRYAYCHPTVMAGEMTHNARDTEARGNKGLQATLARQAQYRSLFAGQIDEISLSQLREATNKAWVLGSEHFKQKIASQLNLRSDRLAKGGDRKSDEFKQNTG